MYSDDRRHTMRAQRDMRDEILFLDGRVVGMICTLADDDYDGTEDARARLEEARKALGAAAGLVELAREQMPVGKQRPPLRSV